MMGTSVAIAARISIKDCKIRAYDTSPSAIRSIRQVRAVDEVARSAASALADSDLVVLAAPVGACLRLLEEIGRHLPPGAVVTDLCSTKSTIVAHAVRVLPDPGRFVASHPVTGGTGTGPESADASIFRKRLCILTPHPRAHSDTIARVDRFWRLLGMKVVRMTPLEHDRRMALASHLPQAVVSALMSVQTDRSLAAAGPGLIDSTRLAGSDGRLWAEILLDNRRAVSDALVGVAGRLDALRRAVESGDAAAIRRMFASAARRRDRLVRRDRGSKA